MAKIKKNYSLILFCTIIIFSAIFFIGKNVFATEYHEFGQSSSGTNIFGDYNGYRYMGQRWVASSTNLSSIVTNWYYPGVDINCGEISVCAGVPNNLSQGDIATNGLTCNWSGNTLLLNEEFDFDATSTPRHTFSTAVPLTPSEDYYIIIDTGSIASCDKRLNTLNTGTGRIIDGGQWPESLTVEGFYDSEYSEPVGWEINPISPLPDSVVGSKFNFTTTYTLPEDYIGHIFYNVYYSDDTIHIYEGGLTATTTDVNTIKAVFLDGIYIWNATLLNYATGEIMASTTPETFGVKALADLVFDLPFGLSEDDVCSGIATTTSYTNLHFLGDIECGLKKTGIWLLNPSDASMVLLYESYEDFKASFPFSAFFDLTTIISDTIATTTTDQAGTIGIPFINTDGEMIMLPIISSSTLSNAIGSSNAILFRYTITGLMWVLAGILIYIQFKRK